MRKIFKSCCGCCSLKVGCIIIGMLDLMQRILAFISFILSGRYSSLLIATTVVTLLGAITTIILLVGAFKYKKWFLLPWLIETALHCIVTVAAMILIPIFSALITSFFLLENQKNDNVLNTFGVIAILFSIEVISLISVGLDIYFFSVVLSFFFELQLEEERESVGGYIDVKKYAK